ncbi:hypothetical protein CUT44_05390 [Streptomyces carminius]|uniref:Uncharacterized protein n=1 Tax=Streptomyces carminius TaxID=2665496 RepID=A0A2M8M4Q9_9ACTN|nr:hypothetical protein CUT44_05390 [Streptomyces carminius]
MTFGTLLSSQGTDASFGTSPEAPPGASLRLLHRTRVVFGSVSGSFSDSGAQEPPVHELLLVPPAVEA